MPISPLISSPFDTGKPTWRLPPNPVADCPFVINRATSSWAWRDVLAPMQIAIRIKFLSLVMTLILDDPDSKRKIRFVVLLKEDFDIFNAY
jgi:hypothetical protein